MPNKDKHLNISTQLKESIAFLRQKVTVNPNTAVILGSGLGDYADKLEGVIKISTRDIPHYPESTVEGHQGYLVFGYLNNLPVMAVQGRTHYYEGHSIQDVAYVVRIMAELGVKNLLVTNAAGGINPRFNPGDLMIIVDHINFLFRNPLIGPVVQEEPRWVDLHNAYHSAYVNLIEQIGI